MLQTFQPNVQQAKKKHGFRVRKDGQILNSRRKKGRKVLSK